MSLRKNILRAGLLAAVLAAFSVPAFAYDWQKVAPKNGGFSMDFPGQPEASTSFDEGEANYFWAYGGKQREILVLAGTGDYYTIHVDVAEELHMDEVNFLQGLHGKTVTSKRTHTRGAHGKMLPSSVFTFVTGNGWKGEARVIVDGQTVYMVSVLWPRGSKKGAAVLKRVMRSYKLVPRTMPPEPSAEKK